MIVCHGKKLLFGKNVGKSRVLGVEKGIFIPDLSQTIEDWGCDMVEKREFRKAISTVRNCLFKLEM